MTQPRLRISVAMCTFNGQAFLEEQLDSIAAQSRLPDELVICDDISTDRTAKIVETFACNVPFPVRFVQNPETLGSTRNFEKAMGLCTGDLIALSDQDDVWMPEKLSRQAETMEANSDLGGTFSNATLIDGQSRSLGGTLWQMILFDKRRRKRFRNGHAASLLLRRNVVTGATLMVRSTTCSLFPNIPNAWYHDGWIAWMLALYSKLEPIEEPLIRYRLHENQHSGFGRAAAPSGNRSLYERIENYRREEAVRLPRRIRELTELERWMITSNDYGHRRVLSALQQNLQFLRDRSDTRVDRAIQMVRILKNCRNYQRYDDGVKCLLRDFAAVLA